MGMTTDDDGASREMTIDEGFEKLRDLYSEIINLSEKWFEGKHQPPVVQEVVLARRSAEEGRMRLGVAQAKYNGLDPWASKVKG